MVNKKAIVEAIRVAEESTTGEICVHIRKKCGEDVFAEAKNLFQKLGLYKTKQRNAVLIFIALESHRFAIVGDTGIHEKVGEHFWQAEKDLMLEYFKRGDIEGGLVLGIQKVGEQLKSYFPGIHGDVNELSNTVTED